MRYFTAIFIHCGAIFSTWDLFQGFSSTVSTKFTQLSGHQKWDFLKGFQPQCTPGMRKKNSLENFQLLWSWNETVLEDFHPQSSLNNPKKHCMYKGQNSNFEWVTATVNTFGMGIWTAQLFVYIFYLFTFGSAVCLLFSFWCISQLWLYFSP